MVWLQLIVFPHVSVAVQVRTIVLLQSVPLGVSLKPGVKTPSQLSLAVTVATPGTSAMH
jgi:hypothetical protein